MSSDDRSLDSLRQSEQQHRLLLDTLPHGVQRNDCDGVVTYSNPAHHEILGLQPGELVGAKIWDFIASEEDKHGLQRYLKSLVAEQPPPVPYLSKNRRTDGSIVDLQVEWTYEHDDEGRLRGFISVITDVTEHRRDEEQLRQRNQGLAELLAVSQGFVETLDVDRILQRAVDGVAKLVGLDTAAVYLVNADYLELKATTPPLPDDFPDELRLAPLAEHPHAQRAIESCKPMLLPDMSAERLTAAERAVAEQRSLRTVLFLPMATDARAIGVFIVGSRDEPKTIDAPAIDLSRTLANLAALTVRNAQLFEQGKEHAAQLERSLLERLSANAERQRLQEQLVQAQKMESVGRLAGGVAHDFNNMLAVILGHAGLALEELRETHPLYEHLTQILYAAERSSSLTRQLLAFARKQTIDPKLLDLNDVVGDMLKMLQRLIGEDITIAWSPAPDLGLVHMDPAQIDQILANLCVNARDAIFTNGTVTISTADVSLDERSSSRYSGARPGNYVMIAVGDTGRGMDEATKKKIFEPFFTTKEAGKGTGLGLSTVYGIVKQNDGFVDVDSAPGEGTTIRIYFPEGRADAETPQVPANKDPLEGGHETILLVEDEAVLLALAEEMLGSLGYTVLAAQSPRAALELAGEATGPIHLLVTDVVMPEMNGSELAEALRGTRPGIKTLFVSGYSANVIAHRGVLGEGVMLLPKPFSKRELAAKVRETLD